MLVSINLYLNNQIINIILSNISKCKCHLENFGIFGIIEKLKNDTKSIRIIWIYKDKEKDYNDLSFIR